MAAEKRTKKDMYTPLWRPAAWHLNSFPPKEPLYGLRSVQCHTCLFVFFLFFETYK